MTGRHRLEALKKLGMCLDYKPQKMTLGRQFQICISCEKIGATRAKLDEIHGVDRSDENSHHIPFGPDELWYNDLLRDLRDTKVVRVTGSYADMSNGPDSDIDLYVLEDRPDTPLDKRNIRKVVDVLKKYDVAWDSSLTGYIYTHGVVQVNTPVHLDIGSLFAHREGRRKTIIINGIEFKTW